MLNCAIAEDNLCFRKTLEGIIKSWEGIKLIYCTDTGRGLLEYLGKNEIDLVFLDIGLPDLSGLEVARTIRAQDSLCEIIFITSHNQYVREAVEVYAADYITKPLDVRRLRKTMDRIIKRNSSTEKTLEVITGEGTKYIPENTIFMIEAMGKKVRIYQGKDQLEANHSLREMQAKLSSRFFRSSRSYLVNIEKVTGIRPCSRTSYEVEFASSCKAYLAKGLYENFRCQVKKRYQ